MSLQNRIQITIDKSLRWWRWRITLRTDSGQNIRFKRGSSIFHKDTDCSELIWVWHRECNENIVQCRTRCCGTINGDGNRRGFGRMESPNVPQLRFQVPCVHFADINRPGIGFRDFWRGSNNYLCFVGRRITGSQCGCYEGLQRVRWRLQWRQEQPKNESNWWHHVAQCHGSGLSAGSNAPQICIMYRLECSRAGTPRHNGLLSQCRYASSWCYATRWQVRTVDRVGKTFEDFSKFFKMCGLITNLSS